MVRTTLSLFSFAVVLMAAVAASADSLPSSKAAVAYGALHNLVDACQDVGGTDINGNPVDCPAGATNDTGWVNALQTFIKTPNGKDLHFDVSLQCYLGEVVKTKSSGMVVDSATASNNIRARVRVVDVDSAGNEILGTVRFAAPSAEPLQLGTPDGDPTFVSRDGVTYCGELLSLSAALQGALDLSTTACFDGNPATTCTLTPEEIQLVLESLRAHAFNFILPNVTSGIKKVTVQARAESSATLGGSADGTAKGRAVLGLGSMVVETLRLVQGFTGNEDPVQEIVDLQ